MHWRGDAFTDEQKARNFAYYDARTVRDSSLSAATQAVLAAEVGHLELAHDYIAETSLVDLRDVFANTRDGVHIASLAGAWIALVAGLGGMRDHGGRLSFAPRLPSKIDRLSFSVRWRGLRVLVNVTATAATYTLSTVDSTNEEALEITHHGEPLTLRTDSPATRPIPSIKPLTPRPNQPSGRVPHRQF
jgi:alpha,alpha-trehalose phosphorylase